MDVFKHSCTHLQPQPNTTALPHQHVDALSVVNRSYILPVDHISSTNISNTCMMGKFAGNCENHKRFQGKYNGFLQMFPKQKYKSVSLSLSLPQLDQISVELGLFCDESLVLAIQTSTTMVRLRLARLRAILPRSHRIHVLPSLGQDSSEANLRRSQPYCSQIFSRKKGSH